MTAAATKKKVLLVDDDEEIIMSMKIALESRGYQVLTANDGNAGLAVVERDRPDLMITDMMMPKRSGFLVLEKLRTSDDQNKNVMKVIMVTGNEGNRHKEYAEQLGVDDYIRKPFAMERLIESVEKLIGQS
jgi:DNA-binding response OmpR family regulator